jgi:hypothetical protein
MRLQSERAGVAVLGAEFARAPFWGEALVSPRIKTQIGTVRGARTGRLTL